MSKELYDKIRLVLERVEGVIALQEKEQHWVMKGGVITWGGLREEILGVLRQWEAENAKMEEMSRQASAGS